LYGYYDLTAYNWPQGEDEARTALGLLLSGRANKVSFDLTAVPHGSSFVQTWRHTWERVGAADVTIGNRTVKTVTFRLTDEGRAGNGFLGTQELWYDPADHLFVKGHWTMERGNESNRDFQLTSISPP